MLSKAVYFSVFLTLLTVGALDMSVKALNTLFEVRNKIDIYIPDRQ